MSLPPGVLGINRFEIIVIASNSKLISIDSGWEAYISVVGIMLYTVPVRFIHSKISDTAQMGLQILKYTLRRSHF